MRMESTAAQSWRASARRALRIGIACVNEADRSWRACLRSAMEMPRIQARSAADRHLGKASGSVKLDCVDPVEVRRRWGCARALLRRLTCTGCIVRHAPAKVHLRHLMGLDSAPR